MSKQDSKTQLKQALIGANLLMSDLNRGRFVTLEWEGCIELLEEAGALAKATDMRKRMNYYAREWQKEEAKFEGL